MPDTKTDEMVTTAEEEFVEVVGDGEGQDVADEMFAGDPDDEKEQDKTTNDTPTGDGVDDAAGDDDSAGQEDAESDSQTSADDDSRDEPKASDEEFSTQLLARAQQLGMSEDIAKRMGTPSELITVISRIEESTSVAPKEEVRIPEVQVGVKEEKSGQEEKPAPPGKFKLNLDADDIGEDLAAQLDAMNDHYAAQNDRSAARIQEMQVSLDQGAQSRADAQANQIAGAYDPHFERLGREDLFGKGSTLDMDVKSPEFEARVNLMMFGQRHIANLKQFGSEVPAEELLFDGLFQTLYPGQRERQTADKIGKTLRERQTTVVPSPSGESSQKDSAKTNKVEERFKELRKEGRV